MKAIARLLAVAVPMFSVGCNMFAQTNGSPAYDEVQLGVIQKALDKWEPDLKYSVVKDIFKGRSFQPDWDTVKPQATPWEQVPDSFPNEQEARRAGCRCDFIKNTKTKTGLLKLAAGQEAWIFVYDQDAGGKYTKNGVITPPTWYSLASVALVDVLGKGAPKFILIEHQGDSGTGRDEKIHWMLGWDGKAFRTVWRETVLWYNAGLGENVVYRMKYRFVKGKRPGIEASYFFDKVLVTAHPYEFHSGWRDWLFWNEKTFSFYDPGMEDDKIENGAVFDSEFTFRSNIERNRKGVLALPTLPPKMWEQDAVQKYWYGGEGGSSTNEDRAGEQKTKAP
jgi:hypothetical protein